MTENTMLSAGQNANIFQPVVGQIIDHALRRTVTQTDNSWMTLLALNTSPHFDVTYPTAQMFGGVLLNSIISLSLTQGMSTPELGGDYLPCRGFDEIRMLAPAHPGDTLRSETTILAVEPTPHSPRPTLLVRQRGYTQNDIAIVELVRRYVPSEPGAWHHEVAERMQSAPTLDPNRTFTPQVDGPFFEDFSVGDRYDHTIGRTIFADESIWISLLHFNTSPYYINAEFAAKESMPGLLIDDNFILSLVGGLGIKHTTQRAVANLGWRDIQFFTPVYSGDTIFSETEVLAARESKSRPHEGVVTVRTIGRNQNDAVVLSYERTFLARSREWTGLQSSSEPAALSGKN